MPLLSPFVLDALVGFCLLSAIITYSLGIFVYAQKTASPIHRLFLVLTLAATYWGLGEFFIWQATDFNGFLFWLKASSVWTIVFALTVHFIIAFTDAIPSKGMQRIFILGTGLYLPAVIFALIGILTDWIYIAAYEPGFGYVYLPVLTNPVCQIIIGYYICLMVWAVYAIFLSWRRAPHGRIRRQNYLVCVGVATVIAFGFLSAVFFPAYGIYAPNLVFIGIVIFSMLIAYAIRRYGLFVLSPETAVTEILGTMPDGMVLVDQNGHIIAVNQSATEIFGDTEAGLVGRDIGSLIPDGAYEDIRQTIFWGARVSDFEATLPNEIPRVVSIAGSMVMDRDEKPAGTVLIIRDITERKSSETALRIANEKISLLSQLTRHDINNLVTGLSGYLTILEDGCNAEERGEYLSQSIDIVDKIIQHLQYSQEYQEIGSKKPVWEMLGTMIGRAVENLPHGGVDIRVEIIPVEIYADPLSEKVMYNLLENAIRHGETVTRVSISTNVEADGTLVVVFEDDGIGVGDSEKEKIFRFGYGKNTGFGLAFSSEILSVTDIEISETGTEGKGARFEIRIPCSGWRCLR
ncbi:PAS domain S-box protein [Methanogenium organophilum]|uniref:histidine kinase n=1 Tax=Methanogenium organophilum TaxID=2199 RepID=A0A9X9S5I8_METOG|nr:PAS domain S-box protein [Methanogenium organophilum]WAI01911.1 PAS domain S-box protein [Methanogenium organophilum]